MMIYRCCTAALACLFVGSALANPPVMKNDPKRPVKEISRDLGVTPDQFAACFNSVHPTPGGARPESSGRVHANKSVLLPCLQKANPAITNESLDAVMDRYRPGGRAAQEPRS